MDWFKKHVDTVIILTGILGSVFWMNGKFNDVDKRFVDVDHHFSSIEKDIAIVKTVLVMKQIMPIELAKTNEESK